jgi:hypothetical protein
MDFYLDESGSSGDLIHTGDDLAFNGQPIFVLAALGVPDEGQMTSLVEALRHKHRLSTEEFKSTTLKSKGRFFRELVELLLDLQMPYFLEVVDKRFQICATLINTQLFTASHSDFGTEIMARASNGVADMLYQYAPASVLQAFLDACKLDTPQAVDASFQALIHADIQASPPHENLAELVPALSRIVHDQFIDEQRNDPLAYRTYLPLPDLNKRGQPVWMLPNLSSLMNIYARINLARRRSLAGVRLIHDEQAHFDEILAMSKSMAEALREHAADFWTPHADYFFDQQAELLFANSAQHLGLQLSDLLAGFTMRHVRALVDGLPLDPDVSAGFDALMRATNPVTGSGVNLMVTNMFNEALQLRLLLNSR